MRACRIGVPVWMAVVMVAASCSSSPRARGSVQHPSTTSLPPAQTGLRFLAEMRGLSLGTAVDDGALQHEADYRRTLATQFNSVEPENVMKWEIVHPAPDRYDFRARRSPRGFRPRQSHGGSGSHSRVAKREPSVAGAWTLHP